jgi:hypothetical protein
MPEDSLAKLDQELASLIQRMINWIGVLSPAITTNFCLTSHGCGREPDRWCLKVSPLTVADARMRIRQL